MCVHKKMKFIYVFTKLATSHPIFSFSNLGFLVLFILVVEVHAVLFRDDDIAGLLHVVNPDDSSRRPVPHCSVKDRPPGQVVGSIVGKVVFVSLVENAVGIDGTRSNRENFSVGAAAIAVDVVQARSLEKARFIPTLQ